MGKEYDSYKFDEFDYLLLRTFRIDNDMDRMEKVRHIWSERCCVEPDEVPMIYVLQQYNQILSFFINKGYFGVENAQSKIYTYANEVSQQGLFFETGLNKFGGKIVTNISEALVLGYISFFCYNLTKPMFDNVIIMDEDKVNKTIDNIVNKKLYDDMKEYFGEFTRTLDVGYVNYKNPIFVRLFYERVSRKNYTTETFNDIIEEVVYGYHNLIKTEMEKEIGTFNQYLFCVLTYEMNLTDENLTDTIKSLESMKDRKDWI